MIYEKHFLTHKVTILIYVNKLYKTKLIPCSFYIHGRTTLNNNKKKDVFTNMMSQLFHINLYKTKLTPCVFNIEENDTNK